MIRRRTGSKHDRTGCLTCRYRRKKCVENTLPVCGACLRLNLECLREPKRLVARTALIRATSSTVVSPNRMLDFFHDYRPRYAQENDKLSSRQFAMKYYVTDLSQLLTVSHEYNSFLSEFVPMALHSPALAAALVSWASGHLSSVDERYRITALESRSAALSHLAGSIAHSVNSISVQESNAATSLVLLTSEVCLGDLAGWYNHLVGARNIILSARAPTNVGQSLVGPSALKGSVEGCWVLRNFAYHDVLGSVTLDRKPLLSVEYLQDIADVVDTYLGFASDILILIAEISCLDLGYDINPHTLPDGETHSKCSDVERKLRSWKCRSDATKVLRALGYAYRSAALIYLYRRMRSFVRRSSVHPAPAYQSEVLYGLTFKILAEVSVILRHVAEIPSTEIAESALLFPLFLAGGEVTEITQINLIRERLQLMLEKRSFQNIARAMAVLGEVWDCRQMEVGTLEGDMNDGADWQEVIKRQGCWLLLT